MPHFSVRVTRSDGTPRKGVTVAAVFGVIDGVSSEYTDSDGWATLYCPGAATPEISVDGRSQGKHPVREGRTLSFTVDYH